MKYLLILLFLFSTHSFSGEANGKSLFCYSVKNVWVDNTNISYKYTPFIFGYSCKVESNRSIECKKVEQAKYSVFYVKISKQDKLEFTAAVEDYVSNSDYLILGYSEIPYDSGAIVIERKKLEQAHLKFGYASQVLQDTYQKIANCEVINNLSKVKSMIIDWVIEGEEYIKNKRKGNKI